MIMGQIVPYVKDNVSPDFLAQFCDTRCMIEVKSQEQFVAELCARVARLRTERGWTQQEMAAALGIPFERYKKYENRSAMPPYLIPRFALQVNRDIGYILTGVVEAARRGPRPVRAFESEAEE